MALADADEHRGDDQPHGEEREGMRGETADADEHARVAHRCQHQVNDQTEIADVHDSDAEGLQPEHWLPCQQSRKEEQRSGPEHRRGDRGRKHRLERGEQHQALDGEIQRAEARKRGSHRVLHELGDGALEHHHESETEDPDRQRHSHDPGLGTKQQVLRDQKHRQADDEEAVVLEGVLLVVADEAPDDVAAHVEHASVDQERAQGPPCAVCRHEEGAPLQEPEQGGQRERSTVQSADVHPVLACREEKAPEHRPAEAEQHLVRMPYGGHDGRGQRDLACEAQRPDRRKQHAGGEGQSEERAKTDEPERLREHAPSFCHIPQQDGRGLCRRMARAISASEGSRTPPPILRHKPW